MTVVLSRNDIEYSLCDRAAECSICSGSPLFPPFIYWQAAAQMYICHHCIEGSGKGLMADLIQARAIIDLRALYPDFTLERQHLPTRDRKPADG
jgi:hypothetical protein